MTNQLEIPFTASDGQSLPIKTYYSGSAQDRGVDGVILIHEVWGLTDHIRNVADRIAALGFDVVAPDLISQTGITDKIDRSIMDQIMDPATRDEAQKKMREAMAPLNAPGFGAETVDRLQACYDYLKKERHCKNIAVMGFCLGGTYSYAFATAQPDLAAVIPFYGHPPQNLDEIKNIQAPVMAFYGEQDENLAKGIPDLKAAFKEYDKFFEYKMYPNAGHAFFNDTNPKRYNKEAAEDSWVKVVQFLKAHLNKPKDGLD